MNNTKLQSFFYGTLLFVIGLGGVYLLKDLLLSLTLSCLLAFMLAPWIKTLTQWGIPRLLVLGIIMLAACFLVYSLAQLIYKNILSFIPVIDDYLGAYRSFIEKTKLDDSFSWLGTILDSGKLSGTGSFLDQLVNVSGNFLNFMKRLGIVFIFTFFILLEVYPFKKKLKQVLSPGIMQKVRGIGEQSARRISQYLTIKLLVSVITSVLTWFVLKGFKVSLAEFWGILAGILNFIPYLGSLVFIGIMSVVGLLQYSPLDNLREFLILIGSLGLIQLIVGNFIDPNLQGHRLDLSPTVILISLTLWGGLWGIPGMFLSTPITVTFKIIFAHIPSLHGLSVLMGTGEAGNDHRSSKWRRSFLKWKRKKKRLS